MGGETLEQIERHIDVTRSQLGENLNELETQLRNVVDWRVQFDARPWPLLGVAFGAGLLLSSMARRVI
jgi:ElaB/YqjD/DUF883 family membrane-anchored ribosome-binding protein